jgi:hypothetical protein
MYNFMINVIRFRMFELHTLLVERSTKNHLIGLYLCQKKCAKVQSATWMKTNNCGGEVRMRVGQPFIMFFAFNANRRFNAVCRQPVTGPYPESTVFSLQPHIVFLLIIIYIFNLPISDPGSVFFTEQNDYYDAPINKILHFIWSVGLIKG